MKQLMKQTGSLLLALCLALGMVAALPQPARAASDPFVLLYPSDGNMYIFWDKREGTDLKVTYWTGSEGDEPAGSPFIMLDDNDDYATVSGLTSTDGYIFKYSYNHSTGGGGGQTFYQIPTTAPDQPTNVQVVPGNESLTVTWDEVSNVSTYVLALVGSGHTLYAKSVYTNSDNVTGLTNGEEYQVYVLAFQGSSPLAYSSPSDAVSGTPVAATVTPDDRYTVTVRGSYAAQSGGGSYRDGDTVTLNAGTRSGYTFAGWSSADGVSFANAASATATFDMPAQNVTVTAGWSRSRDDDDDDDSSGGGSSSGDGGYVSLPASSTSSNVEQSGTVAPATIASDAADALKQASDSTVAVRTQNAQSISAATLQSLAQAAAKENKSLVLHADTMQNGAVQGRLYVEPAQLTGRQEDLKLGVYTEPAKTAPVTSLFERHFSNSIRTIGLEQQGSFGARLEIAAKVDLTGLDLQALTFYSYDKATNTYNLISTPGYWVDSNGYLHFRTQLAGSIIISNGPLTLKV